MTPDQIKAAIIGVILLGCFAAGWLVNGWRLGTKVEHLEATINQWETQSKILASTAKACSSGVDEAKRASAAAMSFGESALTEIRKRNAPITAQVARIETLLLQQPPPNANCNDAWNAIENATAGSQR